MMHVLEFLTVLLFVYRVECCQPDNFTSSIDGVSCCAYCPPGSFMVAECNASTSTQCQPCAANTYTSKPNKRASCIPCKTECRAQKQLKAACSPTSDITCECPSHTYWDTYLLRCTACTKCSLGQKLLSPCGKYKDAECKSCSKGMYLDGKMCVVCDYCKKGEMVVAECSSAQNTICKKVVFPSSTAKVHTRHPNTTVTTSAARPPPSTIFDAPQLPRDDATMIPCPKDSGQNEKMTLLSWILLGTVIVLITFLVLLLIRLQACKCKTFQRTVIWKNSGKKDVIVTQRSTTLIKENNIMFNTTPAHVTEQLGLFLNSNTGNNWKILAGKLGYDCTRTQNFGLTPTEATQRLLQDWQQRTGATVFVLYSHLKEMGRDDACSKLVPYLGEANNV